MQWSGSISFGLVDIPVRMFTAISKQDLELHMIHAQGQRPIDCRKDLRDPPPPPPPPPPPDDDEVAHTSWTMAAWSCSTSRISRRPRRTATTRCTDPRLRCLRRDRPDLFERTFYLGPQDDGASTHVYTLLVKAIEDAGLAGICSYIFHNREQLGCLRVRDGVLVLEEIYSRTRSATPRPPAPASGGSSSRAS